ncbi:carboxymethylenebutenolidase homolog [Tigriopus californicus]|uniref:carboxymethylenebutenolidase homolog n=1 Tax=Tigriopus californicus TaxID=6832 RepID=UPI0027DA9829|nr:carboxymethylenebutenolidase homolog [Tigriopus californicus]
MAPSSSIKAYVCTLALAFLSLGQWVSSQSCCPEESWGELAKDPDYVEQGVVERVLDMDLYRVGNSSKCIIWNYDIFGFDSGRTRQLADLLASKGYMVIIPDYYRGTLKDPREGGVKDFIVDQSNWNQLQKDWEDITAPYAKEHGAETFGAIGTCWGSYMVLRLSAYPEVKAGVSMHPSHPNIAPLVEESEQELLEAVVGTPQLFMPAGSDGQSVKPGGLGSQILGDGLKIVEFPTMQHGWTARGDLSNPDIEKEVKRAMDEALAFFNANW